MKKLLLVLIALSFFLFLKPEQLQAQFPTSTPAAATPTDSVGKTSYPLNTNPDVPNNLHTYTQSVFIEMLATATCFVGGFDPISKDARCLGIDPNTGKLGYMNNGSGGLFAVAGNFIGSTFNIPVSSIHYGMYLSSNFGIARSTFAQGTAASCSHFTQGSPQYNQCLLNGTGAQSPSYTGGFGQGVGFVGLMPVLGIWQAFRNMVYFLFVVIFILLGLGIMFRVNVDARTVMTVQNQIPKIIIGLILITLSYAIAGLLIDLMYVAMYFIIYLFNSNNLVTVTEIDRNPFYALGGFGGIHGIAEPAANSIGDTFSGIFDGNLGGGLGTFVTKFLGAVVGGGAGAGIGKMIGGLGGLAFGVVAIGATIASGGTLLPAIIAAGALTGAGATIGSVVGGAGGAAIGAAAANSIINLVAHLIAYLIITIAILSALFRVWIMLIKSYIFIILDVVFAPFWIIGGILPGAPGGVGPWLRSLIANLSAFPTVLLLFMIGKTIQEKSSTDFQGFVPPLIGNLGGNPAAAMANLIGLGLILIMPEAVNITKQVLKAPEQKYASAVGRAIGTGQGIVGKPISGVGKTLFGEDKMGRPKIGTRLIKTHLGDAAGALFGGSISTHHPTTGTPLTLRQTLSNLLPARLRGRGSRRNPPGGGQQGGNPAGGGNNPGGNQGGGNTPGGAGPVGGQGGGQQGGGRQTFGQRFRTFNANINRPLFRGPNPIIGTAPQNQGDASAQSYNPPEADIENGIREELTRRGIGPGIMGSYRNDQMNKDTIDNIRNEVIERLRREHDEEVAQQNETDQAEDQNS